MKIEKTLVFFTRKSEKEIFVEKRADRRRKTETRLWELF